MSHPARMLDGASIPDMAYIVLLRLVAGNRGTPSFTFEQQFR